MGTSIYIVPGRRDWLLESDEWSDAPSHQKRWWKYHLKSIESGGHPVLQLLEIIFTVILGTYVPIEVTEINYGFAYTFYW